ncbi:MAG TPA: energy transducer TonB [Candidatus Elarobacter sp.]
MIAPPAPELLHRPLAALVRAYGSPSSVATRDDGQHVVFGDAAASVDAIVDDDATVHALDVGEPAGTRWTLAIDGKPHTFTFGVTTSLGARDELAADAENEGASFRVFRRDDGTNLVLVFDPKTALLARAVVGDRATMLRLGYLTDPQPIQNAFPYVAPKLRGAAVAGGSGARATVLRLDLDRGGAVTKVSVLVPSGDDAFDAAAAAKLGGERYRPATLGGRAIAASVLREVRH